MQAFGDAAFASPVGKLCGPVKSEYGWHLIVVRDKIDGLLGGSAPNEGGSQDQDDEEEGGEGEESKNASKKKSKAAAARLNQKKGKGK